MKYLAIASALVATGSVFADADILDREPGIKIGERMTLRPYVSFSYTYDSNNDSERDSEGGTSYWSVNPGLNLDYVGGNWNITGQAFYQYHATSSGRQTSRNTASCGEQLGIAWSDFGGDGAGWSMSISERYQMISQNDDYSNGDGKGLWRDRQQFDVSAAFQRRFNERLHASVNASYYWLDYANDDTEYAPLYGWSRWTAGLQLGYTLSPWTDLFVAGNYQGYTQDNTGSRNETRGLSSESQGWTVHAGLGSYLTDRITYRLSGGISKFYYADTESEYGFTYEGDLNWKFAETWATSLLLTSYYRPSERAQSSAVRTDSISWGISKSLVRGKLNATFDAMYRRDTSIYTTDSADDWDLNMISARLGLNYRLNRLLSMFAHGEFQTELNGGEEISRHYDYERWRLTVGFQLSY